MIEIKNFDEFEQALQLALEGLCRDGFISTSAISQIEYSGRRSRSGRRFRLSRCELATGQRVILIMITPDKDGRKSMEKDTGKKILGWIPIGAVMEFQGKILNLTERVVGPVVQWSAQEIHILLQIWSLAPEADEKYLITQIQKPLFLRPG